MALSITGMLWLDAVHTTSIAEAKYVLERVSALVKKYPAHTLSIAHVMYAPAFEQKFKFIDELNDLIQETNCSNGRPVYRLSNIGARRKPVRNTQWNVKVYYKCWSPCGRLLSTAKAKLSLVQFIILYHLLNALPSPTITTLPNNAQIQSWDHKCCLEDHQKNITGYEKDKELSEDNPSINEMLIRASEYLCCPDDYKVASGELGLIVTGEDLKTLGEERWLNGPIIQYYLSMLTEGSKTYAFSTLFYTYLFKGGYSKVARWTSKIDIFSFHKLLIPVHLSVHWCLVVVDNQRHTVTGYDSMGDALEGPVDTVKNYLTAEYNEKKGSALDIYTTGEAGKVPRQQNYVDCGVMLLLFAERIICDMDVADVNPMPSNTSVQRSRIICEVVNRGRFT